MFNVIPFKIIVASLGDQVSDIFDSFIEAIEEFFTSLLAGAASSVIGSALKLFQYGLNDGGVIGDNISAMPNTYNASVYNTISHICDNFVAPIGGMILVIILLYELISVVISGNNFREFDTSIFFKWIFKCLCGIILISNTSSIIIGIFSMGTSISKSALNYIMTDGNSVISGNVDSISGNIQFMLENQYQGDWGVLITFLLFSLVMFITMLASLVIIMLVIISRLIEMFMYISIAPIPMSTFMNREWGTIGTNWLRNILAIAFQGVFIVVAIAIFSAMFTSVLSGIITTGTATSELYFSMVNCIAWSIALCFTIFRSSSISKSIFNAH